MGAVVSGTRTITDEMFLAAAKTLADSVSESDIEFGTLYPPLKDIRAVSVSIATEVAQIAYETGLARNERPAHLSDFIRDNMYDPSY